MDLAELARQKELAGDQERNRLHWATRNGTWLRSVPHFLNGTELYREEFQDNICFRYGMMPQDIPATCYGCDKRCLIKHTLSWPKGGLVLARHDDDAKEWGALEYQALIPGAIKYKPKINNGILQGEKTGIGARQDSRTAKGGADTVGEAQGGSGSGPIVKKSAVLTGRPGQVQVPAE